MKVDVTIKILNLDGTSIPEGAPDTKTGEQQLMTLRSVFCNVLATQVQGAKIEGIEKVRRFNLAQIIYNEDLVILDVDKCKLLKDLVAEAYIPLIVGQVWPILDPPDTTEEPEEEDTEGKGVDVPDGAM